MPSIPFAEVALASRRVASTRSRLQKQRFIADLLARVPSDEIAGAVGWLIEEPLCGPLGVGPAQLWELSRQAPSEQSVVTLREVEDILALGRDGTKERALEGVTALFGRLTEAERALFVGALTGSLRQGSLGGIMVLALAQLSNLNEEDVRRAVMVTGSIPSAADALLGAAAGTTPPTSLVLFRPASPMLAASAASLDEALAPVADPLVEWKIDGLRAQIHKKGERVAIYSRQGNDITAGCAPLMPSLTGLDGDQLVLDGEVVLVGPDAVARPFQDSFSVVASKSGPAPGDELKVYLFDCLHRDGVDLIDEPLGTRLDALRAAAPADLRMPNVRTKSPGDAARFYTDARAAGHEGVMVKDLASPYSLGSRGRAWQKVKEFSTVDLVVLAAEWGSGRRHGFLSNLHLGAKRDDGTFCMVGKTFKGLTDALLRWQTARLEGLAVERTRHVVFVRPELVVEIRFNDVQRSRRYPGGIALRFARVVRYREDKPSSEVEPLHALVEKLPDSLPNEPPRRRTRPAGAHTRHTSRETRARANETKKAAKKQLSLFED